MAAARDYRAEYAARQARARRAGYGSYWQQRTARALGIEQHGRAPAAAKRLSAADMRAGVRALRRKDFAEADRIARRAGFRSRRRRPVGMSDREWENAQAARRVFYYH